MSDASAQSDLFPDYAFTEMKARFGEADPEPGTPARIDHAAEAVAYSNTAYDNRGNPTYRAFADLAQLHATLAVAEQTRLTNLLDALASGYVGSENVDSVLARIREGLGLS